MRLALLAAASLLASTAHAATFTCTAPNALTCCQILIGGLLGLNTATGVHCVNATSTVRLQGPGTCSTGYYATCYGIKVLPATLLVPAEFTACGDLTVV